MKQKNKYVPGQVVDAPLAPWSVVQDTDGHGTCLVRTADGQRLLFPEGVLTQCAAFPVPTFVGGKP